MFMKPQYFEFFIHTWDSVIFAVKLSLVIANGFESSKSNGEIYTTMIFQLHRINHFIVKLCIPR